MSKIINLNKHNKPKRVIKPPFAYKKWLTISITYNILTTLMIVLIYQTGVK